MQMAEQRSRVRDSYFTDLSSTGEAPPWMALLLAALEQQCNGADIIYLPSLLYTPKSFPLQCIPRSCSNTITLYFL